MGGIAQRADSNANLLQTRNTCFTAPVQDYTSVNKEELRQFLLARLRVFYEEELDVPLVL